MKKRGGFVLLAALFLLVFATLGIQCTKMQSGQDTTQVRKMSVTGEIAEGYNSYIIRGKTPSTMIWTILNPEPKVLAEYVKLGRTVAIDVQIVSGDNVNIIKIDGQDYP